MTTENVSSKETSKEIPNAISSENSSKIPVGAPEKKRDLVSLILGILSLFFWLLPLFGFPVSIVGLVFGIKRKYNIGIILNVIGLCLTVANAAIGAYMGATGQLWFQK